ncbi:hypothetical protein DAI22_01g285200 [Oryza sativa Japonica Group]|nr:hypothetical protein DAI22_01g285200 [Oryza sativa Japonica Group]
MYPSLPHNLGDKNHIILSYTVHGNGSGEEGNCFKYITHVVSFSLFERWRKQPHSTNVVS